MQYDASGIKKKEYTILEISKNFLQTQNQSCLL